MRGWRNDPAWVKHYRERDERRAQREIEFVTLKAEKAMLDYSQRRMLESIGLKQQAERDKTSELA